MSRTESSTLARAERNVRDTETNDRSRARGRGALVNYYSDLGMSTTEGAYKDWRVREDAYQAKKAEELANIARYEEQVRAQQAQLEAARARVPSLKKVTSDAWKKHSSKDLKKVTVADFKRGGVREEVPEDERWKYRSDGDDGQYRWAPNPNYTVEASYLVPEEVQTNILKSKAPASKFDPEAPELGLLVNTRYKTRIFGGGGGGVFGQEMHEQFQQMSEEYYNKYMSAVAAKSAPEIQKAMAEIAQRQAEVDIAFQSAADARGRVEVLDQFRNQQLDDMRGKYQDKINTLKEFFEPKAEVKANDKSE